MHYKTREKILKKLKVGCIDFNQWKIGVNERKRITITYGSFDCVDTRQINRVMAKIDRDYFYTVKSTEKNQIMITIYIQGKD